MLAFVQMALPEPRADLPWIAALHPVNALALGLGILYGLVVEGLITAFSGAIAPP